MIKYPVRDLCLRMSVVEFLTQQCMSRAGNQKLSEAYDARSLKEIEEAVDSLKKILEPCGLDASLDKVMRVKLRLKIAQSSDVEMLRADLRTLIETLSDELTRRLFMFIPADKARFYDSPRRRFPKTWRSFESARNDITEACKCYAAGRNTACVSHCMGILQKGLQALATARDIRVSFPFPIVLAEWQNIIDQIESKIRALGQLPKGKAKDVKLKFYSAAAVQFRYFKDAWRNHVAHFREQYDEHQALSILTHVRDFMEHLSTRLHETGG